MPKIVDSNTVTWSESSNELSATVGGDVVVDSVVIDDGGTIGSASDTDAITISSGGDVAFSQDVTIKDGGTIGSASDPDAISIAAGGDVTISQDAIVTGDLDVSNITVDDSGTIGSASDSDAITIASNGDVTFSQDVNIDGDLAFDSGFGSTATAYGVRAWVNYDQSGTPSIRDSGNVSSLTDVDTGVVNINFATAMPDANYSVVAAGRTGGGAVAAPDAGIISISAVRVRTYNSSGVPDEPTHVCIAVVR